MAVEGIVVADGQGGEIPPFEAVYREHFGFVFACLLRLGVPPAAIDDAAQDVFVTVHRQLPGFEGRSSLRSWLFGIVRRIAFRHRRTAQRIAAKSRAFASDPPGSQMAGPAESLEHAQRGSLLLRALDELDEDKRAALTLHVFEDLRGPELAEILGINVDTAYSRIKAARRELRRALVQLGIGDDDAAWMDATRRATKPDAAARQRVAGLIAVRLGTAGTAGATAAGNAGAALATGGVKGIVAAIAVGAVLAIGVGVGERVVTPRVEGPAMRSDDATEGARGVASAPRAPAEAQALAPAELQAFAPTDRVTSPASGSTAAPVDARAPRSTPDDRSPSRIEAPSADALAAALAAEVAIITAAKTAIDADDPERALARLAEHARRFADGQLANERAGYRAIALCAAGKTTAGRGEARVFIAAHPASSLVSRVQRVCGLSSSDR